MKLLRYLRRAGVLLPMFAALVGAQQDQGEWISLCSKCLSPSVSSKTGAGTTSAVAQGRVTMPWFFGVKDEPPSVLFNTPTSEPAPT